MATGNMDANLKVRELTEAGKISERIAAAVLEIVENGQIPEDLAPDETATALGVVVEDLNCAITSISVKTPEAYLEEFLQEMAINRNSSAEELRELRELIESRPGAKEALFALSIGGRRRLIAFSRKLESGLRQVIIADVGKDASARYETLRFDRTVPTSRMSFNGGLDPKLLERTTQDLSDVGLELPDLDLYKLIQIFSRYKLDRDGMVWVKQSPEQERDRKAYQVTLNGTEAVSEVVSNEVDIDNARMSASMRPVLRLDMI